MNMIFIKTIKIRSYEAGLYFRDREFRGLLREGRHWFIDPLHKVKVDVQSLRDPFIVHDKLDVIVRSGALKDGAVVLDLRDYERALVWIDGRFSHVLAPGLYAYWTALRRRKDRSDRKPRRREFIRPPDFPLRLAIVHRHQNSPRSFTHVCVRLP